MPTIAELNQRHPSCDPHRSRRLRALYEGGGCFDKCIGEFLPRRQREPEGHYELRKREAYYRNYLGVIVDTFAAMLFTSKPVAVATRETKPEPAPGDFYNEFRADCDRNGTDADAFFKARIIEAMVLRSSWMRLAHTTDDGKAAENRQDFESRKLGDCWLQELSEESVLDWETTETGGLAWVVVHSVEAKRAALSGGRDTMIERWEHIQADRTDTYAITYRKDAPPGQETAVPLVASTPHRFGRVPVVCMSMPLGLWAGSRLCSPQLAHFRASCAQAWSLSATCYAMPVYKVGDPEEFQKSLSGAGYEIVIGQQDDCTWQAPPSSHYAALDGEIKAQKDEIFRIAQQMALGVENNAAAVGRSAESKNADAQSTRIIMLAYARVLKETIERVYDLVEALRQEGLKWSVEGLDEYAGASLLGMVDVATKVEDLGGIPSRTFRVQMMTRLAEALLPDLDQETKATIREEIEETTREVTDEDPAEAEARRMHELGKSLNGDDGKDEGADRGAGGRKPPTPPARGNGRAAPAASAAG